MIRSITPCGSTGEPVVMAGYALPDQVLSSLVMNYAISIRKLSTPAIVAHCRRAALGSFYSLAILP